jgi:hypothetical protein
MNDEFPSWQYVAAWFDCEGDINVYQQTGRNFWVHQIRIGQNLKEPLIIIKSFLLSKGLTNVGIYEQKLNSRSSLMESFRMLL